MAEESARVAGPVTVPRFNVSGFQAFATPTEVSVLGMSQVVGMSAEGAFEVGASPAVQIGMSPASAKELMIVLQEIIGRFEKDFGELRTPFIAEKSAK